MAWIRVSCLSVTEPWPLRAKKVSCLCLFGCLFVFVLLGAVFVLGSCFGVVVLGSGFPFLLSAPCFSRLPPSPSPPLPLRLPFSGYPPHNQLVIPSLRWLRHYALGHAYVLGHIVASPLSSPCRGEKYTQDVKVAIRPGERAEYALNTLITTKTTFIWNLFCQDFMCFRASTGYTMSHRSHRECFQRSTGCTMSHRSHRMFYRFN